MSGLLLDTNVILLALTEPARLPRSVRSKLLTGRNVVSTVSYWEVVLKSMKGTLEIGDPRTWWRDALHQLGATVIPLLPDHIAEVCSLPPIHRDPFDRILIAQAIVEDLPLATLDREVRRYASAAFRVVS